MVILCRGTEHAGAADVDVLYQLFEGCVFAAQRLLKGVKIHNHDVDIRTAEARQIGIVNAFTTKKATMNTRVQCLDTPCHDL
jgi:hypothetical protein